MSKVITSRSEDYSQWYNDLIIKGGLADYSAVRGCMVIKPYGYSLWENMRDVLDRKFKETGHQNAYFPIFVPKSLFEAEEKNAEGFAKECAVVTHYRLKTDENNKGKLIVDPEAKLEEELVVRPTSEAIIWSTYKNWIQSYRDLPILGNAYPPVLTYRRILMAGRTYRACIQGRSCGRNQKDAGSVRGLCRKLHGAARGKRCKIGQ